jgi:hypothetical protein
MGSIVCERDLFIQEIKCKGWDASICENGNAVKICIHNPKLFDIYDMRDYLKSYTDEETPDIMLEEVMREYKKPKPIENCVFLIYFIDPDTL